MANWPPKLIEKTAKGLWDLAVANGADMVAEWDYGPAEYMRYIYLEQAEAALDAIKDDVVLKSELEEEWYPEGQGPNSTPLKFLERRYVTEWERVSDGE